MVHSIPVQLKQPAVDYSIQVQAGLLSQVGGLLKALCPQARQVLCVSDTAVWSIYGNMLHASLSVADWQVSYYQLPQGEHAKSWDALQGLYQAALACGLKRSDVVLAVGGGIVGDATGFFASTYMRGIPFVQIPTTLLAQVDASIGGKVAINFQHYKNMIGAFYHPRAVWIDTNTLQTLPKRDWACGMAEVVKYALLEKSVPKRTNEPSEPSLWAMLQSDTLDMNAIIVCCAALKAAVVSADPEERLGLRDILNLGHTVAHALEKLSDEAIPHGEAVAIGLVRACHLSQQLGYYSAEQCTQVEMVLKRFNLPTALPTEYTIDAIIAAMRHDKKASSTQVFKFVVPADQFGQVMVQDGLNAQQIEAMLQAE